MTVIPAGASRQVFLQLSFKHANWCVHVCPLPLYGCAQHNSLVFHTMLHRRDSPFPTGGSSDVGGRRPLSLITNQKTFRATTAQTIETESPQSETFPYDAPIAPPMPPRPLQPLPPRNNALRRQSTRRDTFDLFPPQSRQPNIVPMPTPGGFAMPPAPGRGSNRDHPYQYTADYAYRFDTIPPPRSDSGPPHYESADISGGIHADVWPIYNKISQELDERKTLKLNTDLDVVLIFVSLALGSVIKSSWIDTEPTVRFVLCDRHFISPQGPRRFESRLSTKVGPAPLPAIGWPRFKPSKHIRSNRSL